MQYYQILCLLLIQLTNQKFNSLNTKTFPNFNQGFSCVGIDTGRNNYITFQSISGNFIKMSYFGSNLSIEHNLIFNVTSFSSINGKTTVSNDFSSNPSIITYDSSIIVYNLASSTNITINFAVQDIIQIRNARFGANSSEVYADIVVNFTLRYIYFFRNGQLASRTNITGVNQQDYFSLLCQQGLIILQSSLQINIFAMNSSMNLIKTYNFSIESLNQFSHVKHKGDILVYSRNQNITIINSSNFVIISFFAHSDNITGLEVVSPCYILFMSGSNIYQYDYQEQVVISMLSLTPKTGFRMVSQVNQMRNFLILYINFLFAPSSDTTYEELLYTSSYDINAGTSCLPTYTLDASGILCLKNSTLNTVANVSNTSNSSVSNLITNCTSNITINCTQPNNSVINTTNSLASGQAEEEDIEDWLKNYFIYINKQYGVDICYGASGILIASSIKISPQFLMSLVLVFDDLWFYRYHHTSYPNSVKFFLQNVNIINQNKISVWFLKVISFFNQRIQFGSAQNEKMGLHFQQDLLKSDEQIFFTKSLVDDCKNNVIFISGIFFITNLFWVILLNLNSKNVWLVKLQKYLASNSQLFLMLATIVQYNFVKLFFKFGIQLLIPSYQNFIQKINLFICVAVLSTAFSYIFCFYNYLYRTRDRKTAKKFLMICKYKNKSFIYQPIFILGRGSIRAFVHSFLISNYMVQIFTLFVINLMFIFFCIKMRRYFSNYWIFSFYLLYIAFFTIFDLAFYLQASYQQQHLIKKRQLFGVIIVLSLFLISVSISITYFFIHLIKVLRKCNKKIGQEKQKKKSIKVSNNKIRNLSNQMHRSTKMFKVSLKQQEVKMKEKRVKITKIIPKQRLNRRLKIKMSQIENKQKKSVFSKCETRKCNMPIEIHHYSSEQKHIEDLQELIFRKIKSNQI